MSGVHGWWRKRWLGGVNSIGSGAQLSSRPVLLNHGVINIGDEFFLSSQPVQSHIEALAGASINIGNRVFISYGAAISARCDIRIGDGTKMGPFVVIMDNDFHRSGDREASGDVAPVRIGADVNIGARVTILRGADIGNGVRILSGSMVSGVIPHGVTIRGVPATVMQEGTDSMPDIPQLMRRVLGLAKRPEPSIELKQLSEWDESGRRRFSLAIHEAYGVEVSDEELCGARTLAALDDLLNLAIEEAGEGSAASMPAGEP